MKNKNTGRITLKSVWYFALVGAICFEGVGRKFLPMIPSAAFYYLKDFILLLGYFLFPRPAYISQVNIWLYRGFNLIWLVGLFWTVVELFNPEQSSMILAAIGIRAYWLWWAAPPIIANILNDDQEKRRAIYVLLGAAAVVAIFAAVQFVLPADSPLSIYSVVEGEEVAPTIVYSTGRSRVSSTFSYITGFSNFTVLVPTLILALGLDARDPRLRKIAFVVTCMTAATVPMAGARSSILLGVAVLLISAWSAGLFVTRIGRRILMGGVAAGVLAVVLFPDAFIGVQSRFADEEETQSRYVMAATTVVPPLALATFKYPPFGLGTGMQQNARLPLKIPVKMEEEAEVGRYLIELGPVGFLLIWSAKLGLVVALLRAYRILKHGGRQGAAAAALSYAFLTLIGNLVFDHIWQALYFLGCGTILAEVVSVLRARATAAAAPPVAAGKALAA